MDFIVKIIVDVLIRKKKERKRKMPTIDKKDKTIKKLLEEVNLKLIEQ